MLSVVVIALCAVAVAFGEDSIGLRAFSAIEDNRQAAVAKSPETPSMCFHIPQNPFTKEGGLPWMCKNQNLCMACAPVRQSSVADGFDHYRAQYNCQLDQCATYLPYLLCPAKACVAM